MKTYHRDFLYESSDFDRMCQYVVRDNTDKKEYFIWHIGRIVDWKYNIFNYKKLCPDNFNHAAHLWFNYFHELIGFVITEDFNEEYMVFLKDAYSFLYPEMLEWVKENWGCSYDKLRTCVTEKQVGLTEALKKQGYQLQDWFEMTRVFDTDKYKDYEPADAEVTFRSMSENRDYNEHRILRRNAWPKEINPEMNELLDAYIRRSPIYNADYDFVLVDMDGRHVSGCEAFVDYENNTAEIERVCTHSDYYNKGYAGRVILSCLRRLSERGIHTAYLSGTYDKTIYLYGKLGHATEVKRSYYELELKK